MVVVEVDDIVGTIVASNEPPCHVRGAKMVGVEVDIIVGAIVGIIDDVMVDLAGGSASCSVGDFVEVYNDDGFFGENGVGMGFNS